MDLKRDWKRLAIAIVLAGAVFVAYRIYFPPPTVWVEHTDRDAGFTARFPCDPTDRATPHGKGIGCSHDGVAYFIHWSDLPTDTKVDVKATLDHLRDESLAAAGVTLVSETAMTLGPGTGGDYVLRKDGDIVHARRFLTSKRLYGVIVTGDDDDVHAFLDSVRLF